MNRVDRLIIGLALLTIILLNALEPHLKNEYYVLIITSSALVLYVAWQAIGLIIDNSSSRPVTRGENA